MPSALIQKAVRETGLSREEVENLWDRAEKAAGDQGITRDDSNFWPYTVSIFMNMAGLDERSVGDLGSSPSVVHGSVGTVHKQVKPADRLKSVLGK